MPLPERMLDALLPQAVIFDMDGVVIDSHPAHRRAWRLFLRSVGKDVSKRELEFILDGHKRNDILRHFLGELPEAELTSYGEMKDAYLRHAAINIKPIRGLLEFLHELRSRGIAMGLATSASSNRTFSTLQRMNIIDYFSSVITAADVAQGKPHPAVYRLACQGLKVDPVNAFAFEDAVLGIHAAKQAGLRCAGVARTRRGEELLLAGAEFVIQDFVGFSLAKLNPKVAIAGPSAEEPSTLPAFPLDPNPSC